MTIFTYTDYFGFVYIPVTWARKALISVFHEHATVVTCAIREGLRFEVYVIWAHLAKLSIKIATIGTFTIRVVASGIVWTCCAAIFIRVVFYKAQ